MNALDNHSIYAYSHAQQHKYQSAHLLQQVTKKVTLNNPINTHSPFKSNPQKQSLLSKQMPYVSEFSLSKSRSRNKPSKSIKELIGQYLPKQQQNRISNEETVQQTLKKSFTIIKLQQANGVEDNRGLKLRASSAKRCSQVNRVVQSCKMPYDERKYKESDLQRKISDNTQQISLYRLYKSITRQSIKQKRYLFALKESKKMKNSKVIINEGGKGSKKGCFDWIKVSKKQLFDFVNFQC